MTIKAKDAAMGDPVSGITVRAEAVGRHIVSVSAAQTKDGTATVTISADDSGSAQLVPKAQSSSGTELEHTIGNKVDVRKYGLIIT